MNKKVAAYLAGILASSALVTGCANQEVAKPDYNAPKEPMLTPDIESNEFSNLPSSEALDDLLGVESKEESLGVVDDSSEFSVDDSSEFSEESSEIVESDNNEEVSVSNPSGKPNKPGEKPNGSIVGPPVSIEEDKLTITGNDNTKNDILTKGQISINNSDFELSAGTKNYLMNAINSANSAGVKVGFYLTDPDTKMTISYNGDVNFQPASAVKAGVALYAVKQIEKGVFSFDDTMKYQSKHYIDGSGTIQNSPVGTEFTLRDIISRTIGLSDNIGYYMLLDKFGHEGYNEMITELGCDTHLTEYSKWGYMTPQDLNLIWQEINAYAETCEEGKWLLDEFKAAKYNFFKMYLWEHDMAHKSGYDESLYNESAIIYGDRNYIMTVMTTTSMGTDAYQNDYFAKIATGLKLAMKEYNAYMQNVNAMNPSNDGMGM